MSAADDIREGIITESRAVKAGAIGRHYVPDVGEGWNTPPGDRYSGNKALAECIGNVIGPMISTGPMSINTQRMVGRGTAGYGAAEEMILSSPIGLSFTYVAGSLAIGATSNVLEALQFKSNIVDGTAPLIVASTTVVSNLNASLLEGHAASYFQVAGSAPAAHNILSASHGDSATGSVTRGDIITAQEASPKWTRYAISIPAADNLLNVLGVVNGDVEPGYKALFDSTNPTTIGINDTASPGTGTIAALRNHQHASPSTWTATAHNLLSGIHGDTTAAACVLGDLIVGQAGPVWVRYAISVPAASVRNVLGVDNGEMGPTWKAALDATNSTTIKASTAIGPGTSLVFAHRDHQHTLSLDATSRLLGRGTAGAGAVEEMTIASTAGLNLTYSVGALNIGATADTPQFAGLGLGRAKTAGYLLDLYSGADHCESYMESAGATKATVLTLCADSGILTIMRGGSTYVNTFQGLSAASAAVMVGGTSRMIIGTTSNVPLYLGTHDTTAITISNTQVVTCASTLQATRVGIGVAADANLLILGTTSYNGECFRVLNSSLTNSQTVQLSIGKALGAGTVSQWVHGMDGGGLHYMTIGPNGAVVTMTAAGALSYGGTMQAVHVGIGTTPDATASLKLNAVADATGNFLTINAGVVNYRTAAEVLGDIGSAPSTMTTNRMLGRGTAGSGVIEEMVLSSDYGVTFTYAASSLKINTPQDLRTSTNPTWALGEYYAGDATNKWRVGCVADLGHYSIDYYTANDGLYHSTLSINDADDGGGIGMATFVNRVQATQFISTIAIGTTPLNITSTTVVPNLNVSFLEGHSASYFAVAGAAPTAHNILSTSHGDSTTGSATRGDIITAQGAPPKWTSLAASIPAANVLTVLGFANGDTEPAWKTVLDVTTPATIAIGGAGTAGTSLMFAHRDHNHPAPATWTATAHNVLDSTYHGDVLTGSITRGDILYGNVTPKIARLAHGSAGDLLRTDGTDVAWASLSTSGIQPLDSDLTSLAALNPVAPGDVGKAILVSGANAYSLGQDLRTTASPSFTQITSAANYVCTGTGNDHWQFGNISNAQEWSLDYYDPGTGYHSAFKVTDQNDGSGIGMATFVNRVQGIQFIGTIVTGTAPFVVASTTVVANLNASFLEGHNAAYFQVAGSYQPLDSDLTSLAALNPAGGDAEKAVVVSGANAYKLGQTIATSSAVQHASLALGRALTSGLLDVYSAAANALGYTTCVGTATLAGWTSAADVGNVAIGNTGSTYGTAFTASFLGITLNNSAFVQTNGSASLLIGTNDAHPVYIGTNNTANLTIASGGVATFSNTLQATSVGAGRAPLFLIDSYSAANNSVIHGQSDSASKYASVVLYQGESGSGASLNVYGSTATGSNFGINHTSSAMILLNDLGIGGGYCAIGTTTDTSLVIGTNSTANLTIVSGGASTFSSTVRALRLSVGVAPDGTVPLIVQGGVGQYNGSGFNASTYLRDTTAMAQYVGGGIGFCGIYTGTSYWTYGGISAVKANATDNNTEGLLRLYVAPNGGNPLVRATLDASGNLITNGTVTAPLYNANGSTQAIEKIRLSGQEFYQAANTSTDGVGLLLGVNRNNNRQLWFADTALMASSATNPMFRVILLPSDVRISALATDGSTNLPLKIGGSALTLEPAVTCSSTVQSTGLSVGRALTATYELDVLGNSRLETAAGNNQGVLDVVQGATGGYYAMRMWCPSAKATAATEYPLYITTSDAWASNPFGLQVSIVGNATAASRILDFQTVEVNSASVGILRLQNAGGTVSIGGAVTCASTLQATDFYTSVAWTDFFASCSPVGWAASPTGQVYYKRIGKTVIVSFYITGTSNATTAKFTLPVAANAGYPTNYIWPIRCLDAGSAIAAPGMARLAPAGSTTLIECCKAWNSNPATGDFTNTATTKSIMGTLIYEAA